MSAEGVRIELLKAIFAGGNKVGLELDIGDDAAVLTAGQAPLVWTVDVMVQGVHFERAWLSLRELGYRATMAAVSDLAAMGARPRGILSSLILPVNFDDTDLEEIARGQARAANELNTVVCGGNLSRGAELSITTAVLGSAEHPLRRDQAQEGDQLVVSGGLGIAGAGLKLLASGDTRTEESLLAARNAWRCPVARIEQALRVADRAHAAVDLSDGLAIDATRLARASEVTIVLDAAALRVEPLTSVAALLGEDPIELALYGGEDYALLAAVPKGVALDGFRVIGRCERSASELLVCIEDDGSRREVQERGFDHFT